MLSEFDQDRAYSFDITTLISSTHHHKMAAIEPLRKPGEIICSSKNFNLRLQGKLNATKIVPTEPQHIITLISKVI